MHTDADGRSLFAVNLYMCCEVELEQRQLLFGAALLPLNSNHAHGRSEEHIGNFQNGTNFGSECVAVPPPCNIAQPFSLAVLREPSHVHAART